MAENALAASNSNSVTKARWVARTDVEAEKESRPFSEAQCSTDDSVRGGWGGLELVSKVFVFLL